MIVLDTSFVVAYFNTNDQNHGRAVDTAKALAIKNPELYITDYIFGEIVTVSLLRLKDIKKAAKIGNAVLRSCNIISADRNVFDEAWDMFSRQKLWLSFVDCITVATMREQRIREIATFDKDFTKIEGITVFQA
jgi:predicted nucleic acid-binding protein